MRINVVVLDQVFDLGLSAVLDAFQTANELVALERLDVAPFDVRAVGLRRSVRTAHGLHVPVRPPPVRAPDCAIVPAIGVKMPGPLESALARPDIADAGAALRQWSKKGAIVSAACVGTFVLAESGLLDRQRATTTWWLAPLFRRRYPTVELDEAHMIVRSGRFVTAGAALSHMDLALWIIRSVSPQLAELTARYLVVDARPSQSAYALTDHLIHSDPMIQRFEKWVRGHLTESFALDEAAKAAGASKRTLARRTSSVLGQTPLEYVQALRVERAVQLLKTSDASVDQIASRVGYAEGTTLRALLRRRLGAGVRELRRGAADR